jgi:hypothetical protein
MVDIFGLFDICWTGFTRIRKKKTESSYLLPAPEGPNIAIIVPAPTDPLKPQRICVPGERGAASINEADDLPVEGLVASTSVICAGGALRLRRIEPAPDLKGR